MELLSQLGLVSNFAVLCVIVFLYVRMEYRVSDLENKIQNIRSIFKK